MSNESEFNQLDSSEQEDYVENDDWMKACKCGCGEHLMQFSAWKDNDGYVFGHEEESK